MTESEWIKATDLHAMLQFLRDSGKASDRKLRLFAAACVRPHWELLVQPQSRTAVELAEAAAEGTAPPGALAACYRKAWDLVFDLPDWAGAVSAARAAARTVQPDAFDAADYAKNEAVELEAEMADAEADSEQDRERLYWRGKAAGERRLTQVARDIFPFHSSPRLAVAVLAWEGGLVVKLAEAAYEYRSLPSGHFDPDRLAILGDALEDAGCADASLLAHLRSQGPHVRGCVAVDAVLGKS